MKYFAYGSNMSLPRLKQRVPSAQRIGMFTLVEHSLRFHKHSKIDGSAKCDALFTGNPDDSVIGAVFDILEHEKGRLDLVEGLGFGYQEKQVTVTDAQGYSLEAFTYYATSTDSSLLPHSWYVHHVVQGAIETGVPAAYLNAITAIESQEDPDRGRDARERAIHGK
ncbi:gamma-glutamylcyclotransferase family protein [Marinobacter sp. F4216]|uniref:gamma-glutamylcyclotransferase family protein n=1 Tax=Marinobacter sp. F4216 TaxID=2874281 RepID=UPI001CBD6202|nr:gamma-glutamylcyclotransferase family protein [Marinobacter sp. F4216]MBZ2168144.1 gamma-glutamylcyclotransferase [Marinobacter sp. F4216]